MPFVDTSRLNVVERLPGWYGRYFHSTNMTFAHYDFKRGASIHEHFHPQEEVYEAIDGELELTIQVCVGPKRRIEKATPSGGECPRQTTLVSSLPHRCVLRKDCT